MTAADLSNCFYRDVLAVSYPQFLIREYADLLPTAIQQEAKSKGLLSKVCFLYKTYTEECQKAKIASLLMCFEMSPSDETQYEDQSMAHGSKSAAHRIGAGGVGPVLESDHQSYSYSL